MPVNQKSRTNKSGAGNGGSVERRATGVDAAVEMVNLDRQCALGMSVSIDHVNAGVWVVSAVCVGLPIAGQ